MTSKLVLIIVWVAATMWLVTIGLEMVSAPNTIENIAGLAVVALTLIISIKTKCLTEISKIWTKQ